MEKDEKRIEDLVNRLMKVDQLEKAPMDFTDNVMAKIEALSQSKTIVYKPLIPKYVWWLVIAGFVGLVGYLFFNNSGDTTSLSEKYNLPEVSLNPFEGLAFDFSNSLIYATVLFAIMVCIQIPLMRQYFNNRLSY